MGAMRKADAVIYFGNQAKFAEEIDRAQSTVSEYGDVLPLNIALLVEKLSEGNLKVDYSLYKDIELPPRLRSEGRA